jgi:hypothetical protein
MLMRLVLSVDERRHGAPVQRFKRRRAQERLGCRLLETDMALDLGQEHLDGNLRDKARDSGTSASRSSTAAIGGASWSTGRPRVAAPNARALIASPNTLMHSTIRNITISRSPFCTRQQQVRCQRIHAQIH